MSNVTDLRVKVSEKDVTCHTSHVTDLSWVAAGDNDAGHETTDKKAL